MAVSGNRGKNITLTAANDSIDQVTYVSAIHWYGSGTAGDTLTLTDSLGDPIFHAVARGATYDQWYRIERTFRGIKVASISSGSVDILVG